MTIRARTAWASPLQRHLALLVVGICCPLLLGESQDRPVAPTTQQVIHARFVDETGAAVGDLSPEEVSVSTGTTPCTVKRFQLPSEPFRVGFLIDVSNSMREDLGSLIIEARRFIEALSPADPRLIVTFDEDVYLNLDWTTAEGEAEDAVKRAAFYDAKNKSLLNEALVLTLRDKFGTEDPRQVLILIADGIDHGSKDFDKDDVFEWAARKAAAIYTLQYDSREHYRRLHNPDHGIIWQPPAGTTGRDLGGIFVGTSNPSQRDRGEYMVQSMYDSAFSYLKKISDLSDGRHFPLTTPSSIESAFQGVAEDLEDVYTITCDCPVNGPKRDSSLINPQIKSSRPGVSPRAL